MFNAKTIALKYSRNEFPLKKGDYGDVMEQNSY